MTGTALRPDGLPTRTQGLWRGLEVMLICARIQMAEVRSAWIIIAVTVFQPIVFLLVTLLPAADRSAAAGTRVAVGVALSVSWSATAWGAASVLRRERAMGTLARALAGLVDARLIALGKGLGSALLSNVWALATLAVTLIALRQPVSFAHPGALVLGYVVLIASGSAIGLLIGSVFVVTRYGAQVSAFLTFPIILLGGMLIPPELFPPPLNWVSAVISLRWLQEFLVTSALGAPNYTALAMAALLTVGYALGGIWLFGRIAHKARRDGSLDLY
ncbi:MAG: ABC transporter permease [Geodermatophilaceae bacterium]|nr:ABC transporter permease [Geodermatophilaceae bacterium]